MSWKIITVFVLITIVASVPIEVHHSLHPVHTYVKPIAIHKTIHVEEDGPAEYEFSYSVHDEKTGDIKSQKESRKGDSVEGSYELIDSDGHRRLVHYTADKHNGFQAIVHREPTDIKIPIPEKKVEHHKYISAPVLHVAPITKLISHSHSHAHEHEHHSAGGTHVSVVSPGISYHY